MSRPARPIYFSAYPLKAFLGNKSEKESTILSRALHQPTNSRSAIRLFPMVNPYQQKYRVSPLDTGKVPHDIELTDRAWFNHYE